MPLSNSLYPIDRHGWLELLSPRKPSNKWSSDSTKSTVPWVVVGAGFTGLQCARRLAELHPSDVIILLDAREVGQAASGRNSGYAVAVSQFGGVYDEKQKSEYQRVNRINAEGLKILRDLVAEHEISCQWDENGFFHTAADETSLVEYEYFIKYLEKLDVPHTKMAHSALAEKLGTEHYKAGVQVHQGALVQPASLVRGLADSLPSNVQLFENSPVINIQDGKTVTIQMEEGNIVAAKVLLATNFEVTKLSYLKRYLMGSTLSGSFTRILTDEERSHLGTLKQWGVLSLHGGGATVRLTSDGRICLRNTAEYNGGKLLSEKQLLERQLVHRKSFEQRFPQLKHVEFEFEWSGVEGISRNMTNFFGKQSENVYFAGGYNGSGVTRGTAFGCALAEYASGFDSPLVHDCSKLESAKWIPPRPILDIGAIFKIKSRFKGVGRDR